MTPARGGIVMVGASIVIVKSPSWFSLSARIVICVREPNAPALTSKVISIDTVFASSAAFAAAWITAIGTVSVLSRATTIAASVPVNKRTATAMDSAVVAALAAGGFGAGSRSETSSGGAGGATVTPQRTTRRST